MRKVKIAMGVAMLALIGFACSKKENELSKTINANQQLLSNYPSEMTPDNWEEFVYAPKEVIDHFRKEEAKKQANRGVAGTTGTAKRTIIGNQLLGNIQLINGAGIGTPTFLGGTLVEITDNSNTVLSSGVSSTTAIQAGENYSLDNNTGSLCFYHVENKNGTFTHDDWEAGVTTFDLVLISRHILGIEPFTQLWQYLAADINGDGQITEAGDMEPIRQLILYITDDLPPMSQVSYNQPMIYFSQADYTTLNANLAANLPLIPLFYIELTCQGSTADADRFAIKRGDLNGSYVQSETPTCTSYTSCEGTTVDICDDNSVSVSFNSPDVAYVKVFIDSWGNDQYVCSNYNSSIPDCDGNTPDFQVPAGSSVIAIEVKYFTGTTSYTNDQCMIVL